MVIPMVMSGSWFFPSNKYKNYFLVFAIFVDMNRANYLRTFAILSALTVLLLSLPFLVPGCGVMALVGFLPLLAMERIASREGVRRFWLWHYGTFLLWNAVTTWWVCNATVGGGIFAMTANALQMSLIFGLFRAAKKKMFGSTQLIVGFIGGSIFAISDIVAQVRGVTPFMWTQGIAFFAIDMAIFVALLNRDGKNQKRVERLAKKTTDQKDKLSNVFQNAMTVAGETAEISRSLARGYVST